MACWSVASRFERVAAFVVGRSTPTISKCAVWLGCCWQISRIRSSFLIVKRALCEAQGAFSWLDISFRFEK
jgi:hypothetical protein